MLRITVSGQELYNEETECFEYLDPVELELEHSLVSLSKWESKYQKPFLGPQQKTEEETIGYIEAMILTPDFSPEVLSRLSRENFNEINEYIGSSNSATTFSNVNKKPMGRQEIITSELIYFWMVSFNIPFECETWNLNRLFNLLRICSIKNSKPNKMSRSEIAARNRALNEQRKAQLGTRG